MDNQIEKADQRDEFSESSEKAEQLYDYAFVDSIARIALYDDLRSAPRVTEIEPAPTGDFIEGLASKVYEQAKSGGGTIPYTVIREVSENFIHARFTEATVSILDGGNTIRFADQGPGIVQKDKAKLPGFTSAIEPMKRYIRGVGSGLPIVKEYLDFSHGTITIEDNLGTGSVVTISLKPSNERQPYDEASLQAPRAAAPSVAPFHEDPNALAAYAHEASYLPAPAYPVAPAYEAPAYANPAYQMQSTPDARYYQPQQAPAYPMPGYAAAPVAANGASYAAPSAAPLYAGGGQYGITPAMASLSQRERDFLPIFLNEGALGVTDLSRLTGVPQSSTYVTLSKLEQAGLIEKTIGQKRILTDIGYQVANSL